MSEALKAADALQASHRTGILRDGQFLYQVKAADLLHAATELRSLHSAHESRRAAITYWQDKFEESERKLDEALDKLEAIQAIICPTTSPS